MQRHRASRSSAPAVAFGKRFARVVAVKGTSSVVVALADSKAALDTLKLHATMADPLEGSFPKKVGVVEIPWLGPTQRLELHVRLDGGVVSAKLAPP